MRIKQARLVVKIKNGLKKQMDQQPFNSKKGISDLMTIFSVVNRMEGALLFFIKIHLSG